MNTNPTPEVGQVWADNDERATVQEFEIVDFVTRGTVDGGSVTHAVVRRGGRTTRIRVDRLAHRGLRGYRYIGRAK